MPADLISPTPFLYKGYLFVCAAQLTDRGLYQAVVVLRPTGGRGVMELPSDTDPYASLGEALRHGEQQAIRWTHDQLGQGGARF